jgi:hypothetical protein
MTRATMAAMTAMKIIFEWISGLSRWVWGEIESWLRRENQRGALQSLPLRRLQSTSRGCIQYYTDPIPSEKCY